ncbi:MAG: right-handed parallel beta-helix repeat-containing protein [Chloroflexi bacterium]|nr:right-handed parallel beta-helix repeat-containing protein [Chloroflexota bacterium]
MKTSSYAAAPRLLLALALLALACGPLDLARQILAGLATTPTPTASFELHESSIWYVTKEGDDANSCDSPVQACLTIAEAIGRADDDDIINIGAGVFVEAMSGQQALGIIDDLVLRGSGAGVTIIDGDGARGGILVSGDARVVISNLTVRNTVAGAPGNCISIRSDASARVENVVVENCAPSGIEHISSGLVMLVNVQATRAAGTGVVNGGEMAIEGGRFFANGSNGISSYGEITIRDAVIEDNTLDGLSLGGQALVQDSIIFNNGFISPNHSGVGVSGAVALNNVQITDNEYGVSVFEGGSLAMLGGEIVNSRKIGLEIDAAASASLTEVLMRGNGIIFAETSIPGHISNRGTLEVIRSRLLSSYNGALLNFETGVFVLRESTIEDSGGSLAPIFNHSGGSGLIEGSLLANNHASTSVIDNRGDLTLINSTVSGNLGGGIYATDGSLSISYVTIADNTGIGLVSQSGAGAVAQIDNVLVARNGIEDCQFSTAAGVVPPPLSGVNIDTDGRCRFGLTYAPADLLLDVLADNGGFTLTHALLPGSPAIEAATGACPATDQRGEPYSRPFGPACDVGAYEAGGTGLSLEATIEFETVTPTPEAPDEPLLTVDIDTGCFTGPGPGWAYLLTVKAGTTLKLVGYGFQPGWYVAQHPTAQGVLCWLAEKDVTPNVPLESLRLIAIPPKSTATPEATKPPERDGRETSTPQPNPTNTPCSPNDPNCP